MDKDFLAGKVLAGHEEITGGWCRDLQTLSFLAGAEGQGHSDRTRGDGLEERPHTSLRFYYSSYRGPTQPTTLLPQHSDTAGAPCMTDELCENGQWCDQRAMTTQVQACACLRSGNMVRFIKKFISFTRWLNYCRV